MAWILIANLKGAKGDKGDIGNIYLGELPANQNLLTYYGTSYAGSWGVPTDALVSGQAGRPAGAKPGTFTVVPVGSTASIQTWSEYGQAGRVWVGSINSGQRLSPWKEITSGAHYGNIALSLITHIDNIDHDSEYSFWNGTVAGSMGAPVAVPGKIRTEWVGTLGLQTFKTFAPIDPGPEIYTRAKGSTAWSGWHKVHPPTSTAPTTSISTTRSGFKNAALALTQPATSGTEAISNATVRWPLRYGVGSKRARLHIRNWSFLYGTTYGAVSFTGAWMGAASGANFTAAPSKVLNAFTTASNGDEYVSPWFNYNMTENVDHLLSVGFTTTAAQTNMQSRGGCYRSTNSTDAALASGFTGTVSTMSPFDVWLEVEVPAETPILAGFGDSNTVGTGTTFPVRDSWLSQYCRTAKALPYFLAIHGSSTSTWSDATKPMWSRHTEQAKPDAVVYFLGQNDQQDGVTLATLQANLTTMLPIVREKLAKDVYAATITPATTKAAAVNTVRKSYNTWLKTLPLGIKDCFDFSIAVSDDDATIRAVDDFDGVHMLTGGHAKMAAKLSERPVTPVVLTHVEVTALRALV